GTASLSPLRAESVGEADEQVGEARPAVHAAPNNHFNRTRDRREVLYGRTKGMSMPKIPGRAPQRRVDSRPRDACRSVLVRSVISDSRRSSFFEYTPSGFIGIDHYR